MDSPSLFFSSHTYFHCTAFANLWSNYRKGKLGQANEEITQALEEIEFSAGGDNWLELRDVLIKYVNYFAVDSGLASKLLAKQDLRKNRMDQVGLMTLLIMNWKPKAVGDMLSQDIASIETTQLLLAVSNSIPYFEDSESEALEEGNVFV